MSYKFYLSLGLVVQFAFGADLSFQEAWERVLKNNDSLQAGAFAVQKAEKMSEANLMLYAPNITLSAGYAYLGKPIELDLKSMVKDVASNLPQQIPPTIAPIFNQITDRLQPLELSNQHIITASIRAIYPIYMGGAIQAVNALGKLALKDAQEALRLKKLSTFEQLANVYYGVLLNQEVLKTLQSIESGHQLHLENTKKLKKQGQIAKIEVLAAQVAYERAKNDTLKAKDSLELAQLALKTLLSNPKADDYTLSSQLTIKPNAKHLSLEEITKRTLASYPALQMVDIKEKQAKEALAMARSGFIPHFTLFGNYSYHQHDSIIGRSLPSWFVGIQASMPLLDNKGSYQKFQASKIAQLEVAKIKTQAIKDISLLVEKTYKEALHSRELYETLKSSIALAEENLRLQEEAFKQGIATSTQVIDARNQLSKAKIEQQSIAYKYILSIAKITALCDQTQDFKDY
ncbi:hypothetical protein BBW65_02320 [Helicobacter enhydrae]|uniref:TolC family protein n=1 Tax=Helicobacter enhydrae TaxID=222136 RepID=A0A1B1U4M9_9HELI|nr:TolC family protein [Helicobacter enhydrae]ANV97710.1 hypothetical protein BBW65_02320 [Helicobacter enhydrae]